MSTSTWLNGYDMNALFIESNLLAGYSIVGYYATCCFNLLFVYSVEPSGLISVTGTTPRAKPADQSKVTSGRPSSILTSFAVLELHMYAHRPPQTKGRGGQNSGRRRDETLGKEERKDFEMEGGQLVSEIARSETENDDNRACVGQLSNFHGNSNQALESLLASTPCATSA